MLHRLISSLFALSFIFALGACGDTWEGAKSDTGENLQETGEALEDAGEEVND